jgi:hypothetical protein
LLSLASAVFIITASVNYLHLVPAFSQLNVGVSRIAFQSMAQTVIAHIYVNNSVDYTGLSIVTGSIGVYLFSPTNASNTLFKDIPITDEVNLNNPIAPKAITSWDWTLQLRGNQTSSVTAFLMAYNSNVAAHYFLSLKAVSFLQGISGPTPFQQEGNVTLQLVNS